MNRVGIGVPNANHITFDERKPFDEAVDAWPGFLGIDGDARRALKSDWRSYAMDRRLTCVAFAARFLLGCQSPEKKV
ncbi:MAG: hypothetical protein M3A44_12715 [Gammaproteobacteria bacterium]